MDGNAQGSGSGSNGNDSGNGHVHGDDVQLHPNALYRTTTSTTTHTTSSASSCRTVRPSSTRGSIMTTHSSDSRAHNDYGDGSEGSGQFHRQSQYPFYPYSQPQHPHHSQQSFAPVPPARSSSLHVPPHFALNQLTPSSTSLIDPLPSLLVTQATPQKTLKTRRASEFSTASTEPSPTRSSTASALEMPVPPSSLDGDGDGDDEMKGRSRSRDEMEDDSDDEREQTRLESEEERKKARAREKGRERQRRKRERDKKAKEEAKAAGIQAPAKTALTTATHLPIPTRTSSATYPYVPASNFTMSVPSSTSSTYSALPPTQPSWGHSPNLSVGSTTSLSGQSSPGALYSPAVTQSGMPPPSFQYPTGTIPTPWSAPLNDPNRPQREHKPKFRSASSGAIQPDSHVPLSAPADSMSNAAKTTGPSPAKRRKSEPEPEEFRDKAKDGGSSGVSDEMWSPGSSDRPRPRRIASDGVAIPTMARASDTPPMPSVFAEVSTPPFPSQPTQAGAYFASTVLWALTASNSLPQLQAHLGLGANELEEMRTSFATVYEQYRLQYRMGSVSLSSSVALTESEAESYMSSGHLSTATSDSEPPSPARFVPTSSASYFTPGPARSSRPMQPPNTVPTFSTMMYPTGVPGLFSESPIPVQPGGNHSRTRSLSSAEMVNRGLIINATEQGGQTDSHATGHLWPDTPSKGRPGSSDDTSGSPGMTLHSALGSQGFPASHSMDSLASMSMPVAPRQHMRSATDSGQAAYMLGHASAGMATGSMDMDHLQDQANKEDHQRTIRGHVSKASITSMPLQSPIAGQQSVFGDPAEQQRQVQQQHQQIFQQSQQQNGSQNLGQHQQQQQQPFASQYNTRQISIAITGSAPPSRDGSQTTTPISPGFGGGDASRQAQGDLSAPTAGSAFFHPNSQSALTGANVDGQASYGQLYGGHMGGQYP